MQPTNLHVVTVASLCNLLSAADRDRQKIIIGRALSGIMRNQPPDHRPNYGTVTCNHGFAHVDIKSGVIIGEYFEEYGTLLDWQLDQWMKPFRGKPRIVKYVAQLNVIALRKTLVKLQSELDRGADVRSDIAEITKFINECKS